MIYTGPIDEFFRLPLRQAAVPVAANSSSRRSNVPVLAGAPVVNYPNDNPYTRITEFKHLTGQEHPKTSVVYEYPQCGRRSLLSGAAAGERRALQEVPGTGEADHRRALRRAPGHLQVPTTWIRSWRRR